MRDYLLNARVCVFFSSSSMFSMFVAKWETKIEWKDKEAPEFLRRLVPVKPRPGGGDYNSWCEVVRGYWPSKIRASCLANGLVVRHDTFWV